MKKTISLCVFVLLLILMPHRAVPAASKALITIRIADGRQIPSAPLYAALEKGFFEQEGLNVLFNAYPFGRPALSAMLQDQNDFATAATTPFVQAVLESTEPRLLATIGKAEHFHGILTLETSGIRSPEQLKGKRIGVPLNTSSEYFLQIFLNLNEMRRKDIEWVYLNPSDMETALRENRVDAVSLWEVELSELQEAFGEHVIVFHHQGTFDLYWNLYTNAKFLQEEPEAVERVLRALRRGIEWCRKEPDGCMEITSRHINFDAKKLKHLWPYVQLGLKVTQSLLMTCENEMFWYLQRNGSKQSGPNFLNYFRDDILKRLHPENVSLIS